MRLPHSLPYLFVGIRISSGIAVIGAITGELFAGSTRVGQGGLGYSILYAMAQLQTDYLFALVFAATMLGFILFFTVMFFEWLVLHKWHESARSEVSLISAKERVIAKQCFASQLNDGWWLVTHPDHAHLAGEFAAAGATIFSLHPSLAHMSFAASIAMTTAGWRAMPHPYHTQGKPAAFSIDWSASTLPSRRSISRPISRSVATPCTHGEEDPYAAILISMHTHNLLSERADRTTIRPEAATLLDTFLATSRVCKHRLASAIASRHRIALRQARR